MLLIIFERFLASIASFGVCFAQSVYKIFQPASSTEDTLSWAVLEAKAIRKLVTGENYFISMPAEQMEQSFPARRSRFSPAPSASDFRIYPIPNRGVFTAENLRGADGVFRRRSVGLFGGNRRYGYGGVVAARFGLVFRSPCIRGRGSDGEGCGGANWAGNRFDRRPRKGPAVVFWGRVLAGFSGFSL